MSKTYMTTMHIYSLYDNTSLSYEGLYLFPNDEAALRGFRHSVGQIPFPEDKDIIFIGDFDSNHGIIGFDESAVISIGRLVPEANNDK